MTMRSDSTVDLIRLRGLVVGISVAVTAWLILGFLDSNHHGDPAMGFILLTAPAVMPIASVSLTGLSLPVFLLLRRIGALRSLSRLFFILIFVTPILLIECLTFVLWIDGLSGYSPHFYSPKPALATRLQSIAMDDWKAMIFIGLSGGLACWCADRSSLLWSDNHVLRRQSRAWACALTASTLTPLFAFFFCNEYLVIYRSQKIAQTRPYCLLIPSYDDRLYQMATRRWQLSPWHMQASYELVSGSKGGLYDTNHAILVLNDPREYMNWSYYSEKFTNDPLIDGTIGGENRGEPRSFSPCVPERDFAAKLG